MFFSISTRSIVLFWESWWSFKFWIIWLNRVVTFILNELSCVESFLSSLLVSFSETWKIILESIESLLSGIPLLLDGIILFFDFVIDGSEVLILFSVVGSVEIPLGGFVLLFKWWKFFVCNFKSPLGSFFCFTCGSVVLVGNILESFLGVVCIKSLCEQEWVSLFDQSLSGFSQAWKLVVQFIDFSLPSFIFTVVIIWVTIDVSLECSNLTLGVFNSSLGFIELLVDFIECLLSFGRSSIELSSCISDFLIKVSSLLSDSLDLVLSLSSLELGLGLFDVLKSFLIINFVLVVQVNIVHSKSVISLVLPVVSFVLSTKNLTFLVMHESFKIVELCISFLLHLLVLLILSHLGGGVDEVLLIISGLLCLHVLPN